MYAFLKDHPQNLGPTLNSTQKSGSCSKLSPIKGDTPHMPKTRGKTMGIYNFGNMIGPSRQTWPQ